MRPKSHSPFLHKSLTRRRLLQAAMGSAASSALWGTSARADIDPNPTPGPAIPAMGEGYPVKIGVWYTPYWNGEEDPAQWTLEIKLPLLGRYTARNPKIIAQHHRMIKDFGGDFLIFDQTNTIFVDNSRLDHTVRAWYDAMDALPAKDRLELCIAFGGELNQHHNKETFFGAGDYLYKTYAGRPSQFKVDGKPLVLWYIEEDILDDWKEDRWTIKHCYSLFRTPDQAKWGGWGWGSHEYPPPSKECISIKPGWHKSPAPPTDRHLGQHYMGQWLRVLESRPQYVTICDWNNFHEETAIEDSEEWVDYYGTPTPDWYRRISQGYIHLLRTGRLINEFYYQEDGSKEIWQSSMRQLTLQTKKPHGAPILLLPRGWLATLPKRAPRSVY